MARYYGSVQGGRGRATRLGHATSGLHVTAQSYQGDVMVDLFANGDEDWVRILVQEHQSGASRRQLYHGPIRTLLDAHLRGVLMRGLVEEELRA